MYHFGGLIQRLPGSAEPTSFRQELANSLGGKSQLSTIQLPIPEDGIFECLWEEEMGGRWGSSPNFRRYGFLHCSYSSTSGFSVYAVSGGDVHLP